jgi:sugar lactone lactonase YvrE
MTWDMLWEAGNQTPEWSHAGIVAVDDTRIVFGHPSGLGIVILDVSTTASRLVPTPTTEVHGLALGGGSVDALWVADPGFKARPADAYREYRQSGRALLVSLDGAVLHELLQPDQPAYAGRTWRPTSIVAAPDGTVWVADGYGESLIHRFDSSGVLIQTLGDDTSGVAFDCPHGLVVDARPGHAPQIVVADRGNQRLVWLSADGRVAREVHDSAMVAPSCLTFRGDDLLVTDLCGGVRALDRNDRGRWIVEPPAEFPMTYPWPNALDTDGMQRPLLRTDQLNSPHGITVGADGDLYLTEWLIGGRHLRIPYAEV